MKSKAKNQKILANFKVQGSALDVRNKLVKDVKKKIVRQEMGPRPFCC